MKQLLIAVALVFGVFHGNAFADGALLFQSQLSVDQEKAMLNADEAKRVSAQRARPFARDVAVISFDKNALFGNIVRVPSPSGEVFEFTKTGDATTKDGIYVWKGKSKTQGDMIISIGDGTVLGAVVEGSTRLSIMSLGRDSKYQVLLRVDPRGLPPTHPIEPASAADQTGATK